MERSKQIALGTTAEQMKAMYFNATQLKEVNYRLYQLNSCGERYYYTFDENDVPIFFPSVTTILHKVAPENKILTEWKLSLGKEQSEAYTAERAAYGTFLHGQLEKLIIARAIDLDTIKDELALYAESHKLTESFAENHIEEAKADIVAFAKWIKDYDVRPYAVEISLYSPSMGCAGMLDLVANLREYSIDDERKALEKAKNNAELASEMHERYSNRIDAIIDFKSGKKGFYESYEIQLEIHRRMWNEQFPDTPIERIFNIAPKNWLGTVKKVPSYTFEEQTGKPSALKIEPLLNLYALEEEKERKIVSISGMLSLDRENTNVQIFNLADLVKEHRTEVDEVAEANEEEF